jgi:hypothetical protein
MGSNWVDGSQPSLCYFVRTPFVIEESCKEVHTTFSMPQSIAVALLAGLTDALTSNNYLDSIITNKEGIAVYYLHQ